MHTSLCQDHVVIILFLDGIQTAETSVTKSEQDLLKSQPIFFCGTIVNKIVKPIAVPIESRELTGKPISSCSQLAKFNDSVKQFMS